LCDSKTALDGTGVCAGRVPAIPFRTFGSDPALFTPNGAGIDRVAQSQRIELQPLGKFVDGLFQRECSGRIPRSPHRRTWPGVDENVILRTLEVRARIERLRDVADAGSGSDARCAVAR
jgi:hypothetical protein